MIQFNKESAKRLKERYDLAVIRKEKIFMFDDHEFLTEFAKYVLQYLENRWKK